MRHDNSFGGEPQDAIRARRDRRRSGIPWYREAGTTRRRLPVRWGRLRTYAVQGSRRTFSISSRDGRRPASQIREARPTARLAPLRVRGRAGAARSAASTVVRPASRRVRPRGPSSALRRRCRIVTDQLRADRAGWERLRNAIGRLRHRIHEGRPCHHPPPGAPQARAPDIGRAPGIEFGRRSDTCWADLGIPVLLHRVCGARSMGSGGSPAFRATDSLVRASPTLKRHRGTDPTLGVYPGGTGRVAAVWMQAGRFTYRCVERGPVDNRLVMGGEGYGDGQAADIVAGGHGSHRTDEDDRGRASPVPQVSAGADRLHAHRSVACLRTWANSSRVRHPGIARSTINLQGGSCRRQNGGPRDSEATIKPFPA